MHKLMRSTALAACLIASCKYSSASELCLKLVDEAQQPLPAARVHVVNLMGGLSQDRQTDTNGNSCLPALPEGLYSVEASLQGFLNVRYYPVRVSYPQKNALTLKLPIGDISGGGLGSGISLSGTLLKMEKPAQAAEICLLKLAGGRLACTTTNDLGEYALLVPPGIYNVNLKLSSGTSYRYRIDVSATGALYRNLLFIPKQSRKGAN